MILRRKANSTLLISAGQRLLFSTSAKPTGRTDGKMFDKLLVANRGEIACRVMKTARRLGVRTVAVYSDADEKAMHVAAADESYNIGPPAAAESYLLGDKILQVANECGAQAVHPGYGFLSENAGFAESCEAKNVEFVGPPTGAIVSMGSKSESKIIMEAANVPCTPGYHGENQDIYYLVEQAKQVGLPVMLKAVLGGGGKGMRVVEDEKDLESNIEACKREALSSFGDDRILIEKFLRKPRHIEIQVFADKMGNTVYLYERDCSVQRRHQKVLEESPAPGMPEELRKKMGDAAVAAAKAVNYVGAGTVEFMVDAEEEMTVDSPFYFMEMNTRLQVEHPVTELVTGIDLVEWQLRIAAGQPLPIPNQQDIPFFGHSLEARVYAESPGAGFLPGSGLIQHLSEPSLESAQYVYPESKYINELRIETGVRQGDKVSVFYDPMISKVVVHGPDRKSALRQMENALGQYRVVGVPTNIEFLLSCLRHPAFERGGVDTSFIGKHQHELLGNAPPKGEDANAAALSVISRALMSVREQQANSGFVMPFGFRVGTNFEQNLVLDLATDEGSSPRRVRVKATEVEQSPSPTTQVISFDVDVSFLADQDETEAQEEESSAKSEPQVLETVSVQVQAPISSVLNSEDDSVLTIKVNGSQCKVAPVLDSSNGDLLLFDASCGTGAFSRLLYRVTHVSKAAGSDSAGGPGASLAPMPGKVIKVFVQEGDQVEKDQPLMIMLAMKMEHEIKASKSGTVASVSVNVDDFVDDSQVLCKIE